MFYQFTPNGLYEIEPTQIDSGFLTVGYVIALSAVTVVIFALIGKWKKWF